MKRKVDYGNEVRLMDRKQLTDYVGIGRTLACKWADSIGATRRFGKRCLYDKAVIDEALDNGKSRW